MGEHQRFHLRTVSDLHAELKQLDIDLPISEDTAILAAPLNVAGRVAPNRFAVHPMEGFDSTASGGPGELTFRRYCRYAAGGFGLIWMEATAVAAEGRSNPGQLYLNSSNIDAFRDLVAAIRRTAKEAHGRDIVIVMQLTHSGRYSKPTGIPAPIIAHRSPVLDPLHKLGADYPLVTDDYLDRLQEAFVSVAQLAAMSGVDGVDIKSCHRYLVSELHASHTREGRYGGPFENRTRFLRETSARIREKVKDVFVTTRMNAFDAIPYPYGFGVDRNDAGKPDLQEPVRLVGEMVKHGLPLLNISIGNPYFNPHYGRPYDFPTFGAPVPAEHPLQGLVRFLGITRQIQEAYPSLPVIGAGYSWLRHLMPAVASGVIRSGGAAMLGMGRAAFAYPDAVRDVLATGKMDPEKCCVTCSACTQIMRDGGKTGCVVRDAVVYGPQYRLGRRFAVDRLREEAKRCRDCEFPTCRRGCPASVNVPGFIRAFADGDIKKAYGILRSSNALPEMCAFVCPSEVQCEGHCIEDVFCKHPIPIRDIQLVVCRLARRAGYAAVRLPDARSGKCVAIVGAGPTGLAATVALLERGHAVDLFDKGARPGGTPAELIPTDRYEDADEEAGAILGPAIKAGRLTLHTGKTLGLDVSLADLRSGHDALLLATGLGSASSSKGAKPAGVVDALSFLRDVKGGTVKSVASSVAVVGGGNTALDAAVAAKKLGASDVYLVYRRSLSEMPAWPVERENFAALGGHVLILTQPAGYATGPGGRVTGLKVVRTVLGAPDVSGRRSPKPTAGESILEVGLVIEAIGQEVSPDLRKALEGMNFSTSGLVARARPESFETSLTGVFAAGDLVNGGTTAVQGVAEGMKAAAEIDAFVSGGRRLGEGKRC